MASRRERVARDLGAERTRLAAVEQQQRQATDRYIKAPTTAVADALAVRLDELKDQHAAIVAKVSELQDEQRHQQADEQRTIERINVAMADLPQAWADGSLQVRQAIVKLAFPEGLTVDVQPTGQEIRTPTLARLFRLKSRILSGPASRMASPAGFEPASPP